MDFSSIKALFDGSKTDKVLVMDDEEPLRLVLSQMLQSLGFAPESCACGEEAVELYKKEFEAGTPYAAVILDIVVTGGGIDGVKAAEEIRAVDPHATLIASTGFCESLVLKNPAIYGFNGLLPKPYGLGELKNLLTSLLS